MQAPPRSPSPAPATSARRRPLISPSPARHREYSRPIQLEPFPLQAPLASTSVAPGRRAHPARTQHSDSSSAPMCRRSMWSSPLSRDSQAPPTSFRTSREAARHRLPTFLPSAARSLTTQMRQAREQHLVRPRAEPTPTSPRFSPSRTLPPPASPSLTYSTSAARRPPPSSAPQLLPSAEEFRPHTSILPAPPPRPHSRGASTSPAAVSPSLAPVSAARRASGRLRGATSTTRPAPSLSARPRPAAHSRSSTPRPTPSSASRTTRRATPNCMLMPPATFFFRRQARISARSMPTFTSATAARAPRRPCRDTPRSQARATPYLATPSMRQGLLPLPAPPA